MPFALPLLLLLLLPLLLLLLLPLLLLLLLPLLLAFLLALLLPLLLLLTMRRRTRRTSRPMRTTVRPVLVTAMMMPSG